MTPGARGRQSLEIEGAPLNIKSSPLVNDALEAKRPTHWWLAWPLVVVFFALMPIIIFGTPPSSLVKAGSVAVEAWQVVAFSVSLTLLALWVVLKEKRPFSSVGFRGPRQLPLLGLGLAAGVATMVVVALALVGIGTLRFGGSTPTTSGVAAILPTLLLLLVVGVQATTEEVLFRGYLLQVTGSQIAAWPTLILGAAVFAGAHPAGNAIAMTNTVLVALFFSFISLAQGSIWMAAGFHIGWNWSQGNLLGVPVSGLTREVSILALGPTKGATWWLSGGEYGIEASAVATVALAILATWSYFYYRRVEAARDVEAAEGGRDD